MIGGNEGSDGNDRPLIPDEPAANAAPTSRPATFSSSAPAPIVSSTLARGREGALPTTERVRRDDVGPPKQRERSRRPKPAGAAQEPSQMLDLSELPETYGKDEVGILSKDPLCYFVYWEVTEDGEAAAREQLGPSGEAARLMLRLFITVGGASPATAHGPAQPGGRETRELRDVALPQHHGRKYLEAPRPGALLRAAVGLLSAEGYFAPIAHSAPVRMPPQQAAPQASVEWLHVLPAISEGHKRERIIAVPPSEPHEEHLVPAAPSTPDGTLAEQAALFPATPDADAGGSTSYGRAVTATGSPTAPGTRADATTGNSTASGTRLDAASGPAARPQPSPSNGSGGLG